MCMWCVCSQAHKCAHVTINIVWSVLIEIRGGQIASVFYHFPPYSSEAMFLTEGGSRMMSQKPKKSSSFPPVSGAIWE